MTLRLEETELAIRIKNCKMCSLRAEVSFPVRGEGPEDARIVLVGRNPGADEDKCGRPFVGRSGQKLNEWLEKIGLKRYNVGIVNLIRCYTPKNRPPEDQEISNCKELLKKELSFFKDKKILVLFGTDVVNSFLNLDPPEGIMKLAGRTFSSTSSPYYLFTMYHPSYVVRNPREEPRFFNHFAPKLKELMKKVLVSDQK